MARCLVAGAAISDITPRDPQFLFGYPHVRRYSTGVHDPLLSSALFLSDGDRRLLFSANDVIFIGRETARRVRRRIEEQTGIPAANIMVTATHTHSGPITADMVSNELDQAVPKANPRYIEYMENGIVDAAVRACRTARPATIGMALADGSGVGTHRHEVCGPSDPQVPVLAVRDAGDGVFLAVMLVCSMHPTVLHEDSTPRERGFSRDDSPLAATARRRRELSCAPSHRTVWKSKPAARDRGKYLRGSRSAGRTLGPIGGRGHRVDRLHCRDYARLRRRDGATARPASAVAGRGPSGVGSGAREAGNAPTSGGGPD